VPASLAFPWDGGRTNGSPLIRDMRVSETPKSTNPSRLRIYQPRQPNTGNSASSSKPPLLFRSERTSHSFHFHSASAVDTHSPSKDDITVIEPQYPLLSACSPSPSLPPVSRSRTPDPAYDELASVDHIPLSRYSTTPAAEFEHFSYQGRAYNET